jgi:hypothetical protein
MQTEKIESAITHDPIPLIVLPQPRKRYGMYEFLEKISEYYRNKELPKRIIVLDGAVNIPFVVNGEGFEELSVNGLSSICYRVINGQNVEVINIDHHAQLEPIIYHQERFAKFEEQLPNVSTTQQFWNWLVRSTQSPKKAKELILGPELEYGTQTLLKADPKNFDWDFAIAVSDGDPDNSVPAQIANSFRAFESSNKLHLLKDIVEAVNLADTTNGGYTRLPDKIPTDSVRKLNAYFFRQYIECANSKPNESGEVKSKTNQQIWDCSIVPVRDFMQFCLQSESTNLDSVIKSFFESDETCCEDLRIGLEVLRSTFEIDKEVGDIQTFNTGMVVEKNDKNPVHIGLYQNFGPDSKIEIVQENQKNGIFCPIGLFYQGQDSQGNHKYTINSFGNFTGRDIANQLLIYLNTNGVNISGSWRSGGNNNTECTVNPTHMTQLLNNFKPNFN